MKVGVWENEKFVGVVIFSYGATPDLVKPYGLKMIVHEERILKAWARRASKLGEEEVE